MPPSTRFFRSKGENEESHKIKKNGVSKSNCEKSNHEILNSISYNA